MTAKATPRSWTCACTVVWTLLCAGTSLGALLLPLVGQLNRQGCAWLLALGAVGAVFGYHRLVPGLFPVRGIRPRRFRRPFPLLYLICLLAALIGGAIHPPTNHDALCYRIPRLLHWVAEGRWHWIHSFDPRMNFSATGFEVMMLPSLEALHTLRFSYLINFVSFLLLPGLVFDVFKGLGVRNSIAAKWMWILPCGSCFVMEAGSIGNDLPACAHVLAGLMFALRSLRNGSAADAALAVVSAALMTGMKASNLPLLLPVAICLLAAIRRHPKLVLPAAAACVLSLPVSFFPVAAANVIHAGHWSGDPGSPLVRIDPLAGLAGNTLLIGSAALVPAVFPQAEKVNSAFNASTTGPPLRWIKAGFMDFRMTHPQLASEENSGLGVGVTATLLLGLAASWKCLRPRRLLGLGGWVTAGFWFALVFYMIKLGNCGAPRLVAPYYAGLILPPLLLAGSGRWLRRRWWITASVLSMLPIIPALVCNPARPLLPMISIVHALKERGFAMGLMTRMETVYQTYANRSDANRSVRDLLPPHAKVIGFAGTSGESQYSFWLPLGERRVVDFMPTAGRRPPDPTGLEAIVASEWGCMDRFGKTPRQLADHLGWQILGTTPVRSLASAEPVLWSVLAPGAQSAGNHR